MRRIAVVLVNVIVFVVCAELVSLTVFHYQTGHRQLLSRHARGIQNSGWFHCGQHSAFWRLVEGREAL